MTKLGGGLRYNQGKVRMDLVPAGVIEKMAEVFTEGAKKYSDWNWAAGMRWSTVLASLKRHLADFESGMDTDPDDGQLLMAKVMTNAAFLTEYYRIYPQGDDRQHQYLKLPKIGLDIDDVLADFIPEFAKRFNLPIPTAWAWTYNKSECFKQIQGKELDEFLLALPPKIDPSTIPFEPHCYITARNSPKEITEKWLEMHGFPCAPVISVGHDQSKVDVARGSGIDVFVDDRFDTFVELNNAGICTYLFDCTHNQRYDVGSKRIYSLNDLPWFKKKEHA